VVALVVLLLKQIVVHLLQPLTVHTQVVLLELVVQWQVVDHLEKIVILEAVAVAMVETITTAKVVLALKALAVVLEEMVLEIIITQTTLVVVLFHLLVQPIQVEQVAVHSRVAVAALEF
jgi:hypothetical protein